MVTTTPQPLFSGDTFSVYRMNAEKVDVLNHVLRRSITLAGPEATSLSSALQASRGDPEEQQRLCRNVWIIHGGHGD